MTRTAPYRAVFLSGIIGLTLGLGHLSRAIEVSGELTGGVWRSSDSPIRVVGDILLPAGQSLQIEEGVQVIFTGPYTFTVRGKLEVLGRVGREVLFTAQDPSVDSLRWRGLRFIGAERGSRLEYAIVEYGWARGPWPMSCGGGLYIENCSPTILRSVFKHNRAQLDGGGIYLWNSSSPIKNTLVVANRAGNNGGGIFLANSHPQILNCTIAVDTARGWGGGIFVGAGGRLSLTNSIVVFNHQVLFQDDADDYNNLPSGDGFMKDLGRVQSARVEVNFSCISADQLQPFAGLGNITADPLFVRYQSEPFDFRLKYSSPCIDAGDRRMNPGDEPDRLVGIIDMGAYGGTELATLSLPVIYNDKAALRLPINFGQVRIGLQVSQEIKIENRGHYRLFLRDFRFTHPDFYPDSARADTGYIPSYLAAPIEPGELGKYAVQFKPSQLGIYEDTLFIYSTDTLFGADSLHPAPLDPRWRRPFIILRGEGIDPIALADTLLDFGRRPVGSRTTLPIWVKNRGRSRLEVSGVNIQGQGFDARVVNSQINPGDSGRVEVTFTPNFPETYERVMSIRTNDRNLFLTLRGRGYGPKMVIPDTVKFIGYAYYGGDTIRGEIPITNTGDGDLVIDSLRVEVIQGPAGAFTPEIPPGGLVIPPDSSKPLIVRFHPPRHTQDYESRLTVYSNYPLLAYFRVKGRGMALPGRYLFGQARGVWESRPGDPPFIVLDSVIVPSDEKLRIMPGVVIKFEPGAFLRAEGQLRALGTQEDSIHFLPRDTSGTPSARWKGLEIIGENGSRLSYCIIRGSKGGVRVYQASPLIQFCTIADNGDTAQSGGGVFCDNSGAILAGNRIVGNFAQDGGAVYILNSKVKLLNCFIAHNRAQFGSGVVVRFLSAPLFYNNIIVNNTAEQQGTILISESSTPWWLNNTIFDNQGGGFVVFSQSIPTIVNSIVGSNDGPSFTLDATAGALVSYSFVEGGFTGRGNFSSPPPRFDHSLLPYALSGQDTAFIDHGNPEKAYRDYSFPPSQGTTRNDLGAYGGPYGGGWESPEIAISVLQNPALPYYLDIIITAQEPFTSAPLCSLEFGEEPMQGLMVTRIDSLTYRSSYRVKESGPLLITAESVLANSIHQKVSRDFQAIIVLPSEGGYGTLGLWEANLHVPAPLTGSGGVVVIWSDEEAEPAQGDVLFFTLPLGITGLSSLSTASPATLALPKSALPQGIADRRTISLYHKDGRGWERLPTEEREGGFIGELKGDGFYIWGAEPTGDHRRGSILPDQPSLLAYPNPFNSTLFIAYQLESRGRVHLEVWSMAGERLWSLTKNDQPAGRHLAVWDGRSAKGAILPSGIYLLRLRTGEAILTQKVVMIR